MPDRLSPAEFQQLMESWDLATQALIRQREATNFTPGTLRHFSGPEALLLRAIAQRLIPQHEEVDLVGFLDATLLDPLGRGDRPPGVPPVPELLAAGLQAIQATALDQHGSPFEELPGAVQDALLTAIRAGNPPGIHWAEVPADAFFLTLYRRLLHGYFAHPAVWRRIGFYGAAYPEGYTWLSGPEVAQRHARAKGWDTL